MHSFIYAFTRQCIGTNLWMKPPWERKPWEFTPSTHSLIHSFIQSVIHSFIHSFTHSFTHSFIQTFEWNNLVRGNLVRVSFHSSPLSLSVSLSFFVSFGLSLSLSFVLFVFILSPLVRPWRTSVDRLCTPPWRAWPQCSSWIFQCQTYWTTGRWRWCVIISGRRTRLCGLVV